MWEEFKKKVINFIYEEIEEEEEFIQKEFSHEKKQAREKQRDEVKARMTFQYPKEDSPTFRFPVIPDEHETRSNHVNTTQELQDELRRVDHNEPAFVRRTRRKRKKVVRTSTSYRSIYEQKKLAKELEDVPAYVRRRKKEENQQKEDHLEQENIEITRPTNSTIIRNELIYSTPDELDAVFKRKRKKEIENETVSQAQNDLKRDSFMDSELSINYVENDDENEQIERLSQDTLVNDNNNQQFAQYIETDEITEAESYNTSFTESFIENKAKETNETAIFAEHAAGTVEEEMIADSMIDIPHYLLDDAVTDDQTDKNWLREQKRLLKQTLEHFNVDAEIVAITQGPTVTRIEIQPALGVKVSRIRNLADDIKLNLAAKDIRIEAPIPGKHTVGIEVPNKTPQIVHLQEMIESEKFQSATSPLTIALGLTIEGEPYITDISKMPHGLIAGATGSGKSVCINTMILSLLYKAHYNEVKLMLIDPKMVELTQYNGIPHLLTPVITDVKAATIALKWAVDEMERRYELFVEQNVRNIKSYNRKVIDEPMPYIVIIIDELADLMLVAPQEVEDYISRIAQKARAAGIHLILATQRPSVDVITGLIKANIPSRIAFAVSSQIDSRTILDKNGAEKLLGKGDMLFIENGTNKHIRLQGPFVSDDEIDRVVAYLRSVSEPNYLFEHEELFVQIENEAEDELFEDVVEFILEEGKASTSLLQRRFRIGYNRAARLIDSLYDRGIISAQNGSKPREVLITKSQWKGLD
mgnify:CR=1 FL=1